MMCVAASQLDLYVSKHNLSYDRVLADSSHSTASLQSDTAAMGLASGHADTDTFGVVWGVLPVI